jgi:23S rRNA (uracil1939-C5)-methyltransferase
MAEPLQEGSIVALDAHGHGLTANGAIVPGALPGERTLVKINGKRAELVETLDPAPERATPICPWFEPVAAASHSTCRLPHYACRPRSALSARGVVAKVATWSMPMARPVA